MEVAALILNGVVEGVIRATATARGLRISTHYLIGLFCSGQKSRLSVVNAQNQTLPWLFGPYDLLALLLRTQHKDPPVESKEQHLTLYMSTW